MFRPEFSPEFPPIFPEITRIRPRDYQGFPAGARSRKETAASGERYPGIYRITSEGGTPQLYVLLPEDCDTNPEGTMNDNLQLALSLDASMAVCTVLDQRHDVHIVENFDAGPR